MFIRHNPAVSQGHDTFRVASDAWFVGDHDDRVPGTVQFAKQAHNIIALRGREVARGRSAAGAKVQAQAEGREESNQGLGLFVARNYVSRMSGSGATCFGLFESAQAASAAAAQLQSGHPAWWVKAATLGGVPTI